MKNFISANFIALISALGTLIIGATSLAWKSEKKEIYQTIGTERIMRQMGDSMLNATYEAHEIKHIDEENQRIERDKLKRDYFDAKFTGLEKLILSTN
jgi:hypothetical protein